MDIFVSNNGDLAFGDFQCRTALGRSGLRENKREGDGATPIGRFPLRRGFFRADRLVEPSSPLSFRPILPDDGWCDDPNRPEDYNRLIKHPFSGSAEYLWRNDRRYDLIVVLGHNDDPPIPGLGSAVFLHVASPGHTPTEGCVAMETDDLMTLLKRVSTETRITIGP